MRPAAYRYRIGIAEAAGCFVYQQCLPVLTLCPTLELDGLRYFLPSPVNMKEVHLLVACHGMWGNPDHLAELARHAREKFAQEGTGEEGVEFVVLVAQTNRDSATYDGIDWGGERIADEASPK